jgi:MFS family permease
LQHGFLVAQTAIADQTSDGATRLTALGYLTTAYTVGASIGPALGGYLGESGNYFIGAKVIFLFFFRPVEELDLFFPFLPRPRTLFPFSAALPTLYSADIAPMAAAARRCGVSSFSSDCGIRTRRSGQGSHQPRGLQQCGQGRRDQVWWRCYGRPH